MAKIKIAIIGATGTAYKRTIPALNNSAICEIVAIQGRNIEKLKKIQGEFNIQNIYLDEDEMLSKADFDCIYIGTPPFLHSDNIEKSVKTSKPIICEKPLSINYEQGLQIQKQLHSYDDASFRIAHHLRHQKAVKDIKEFIDNGLVGEVLNVSMQWGFEMNLDAPNALWKTNPSLGGQGTFSDNGIHIVDLALYLFGMPSFIYGKVESVRTKDTYDNETAFLIYSKMCIQLQSSQSMKYPGNHIFIYGTLGSIEVLNGIGEKSITKVSIKSPTKTEDIIYSQTNLYGNEVEDFCHKLQNPTLENTGTTLKDGLDALRVIDVVRQSARENRIIDIN